MRARLLLSLGAAVVIASIALAEAQGPHNPMSKPAVTNQRFMIASRSETSVCNLRTVQIEKHHWSSSRG